MRFRRPFCQITLLAAPALAALMLLTPASMLSARAQAAQAAQQPASTEVAKSDSAGPQQQKSLTAKAIEKVKKVAKSAADIFSRVPCLSPKGVAKSMGSLPHVASKLASGEPVVIVAFGSSSTVGYGTTSPEFTYPNRLAAQLHRQYPTADITVINRGQGGEDAPEMMKRLQTSVIDPDATDSDALSTVAFVLKPDASRALFLRHPGSRALIFTAVAGLAGFAAYFSMYAFRKPFSAASFAVVPGWHFALDYKIALVLAQVLGYAVSKMIGIKVISELNPARRASAIVALILLAGVALLLFAAIPAPWNVVAMFFNGLPLGMIWGLVFGFMEGRRTYEVLGAILCASFIVSSGAVKSVGTLLMTHWHVDAWWMPAATGALFLPLLFASV